MEQMTIILPILIFILLIIFVWYALYQSEIVWADYDDVAEVMTVEYRSGVIIQYEGDCTVWHELPFMKRCSTSTEVQLAEIQAYIKFHGGPYPKAHLNKTNK